MKSYRVTGLALIWLADYLFPRLQVIKLGGEFSSPLSLACGTPQGSILGPISFLLFFNDLSDYLHHSDVAQLSDDTLLYPSPKSVDEIKSNSNEELALIQYFFDFPTTIGHNCLKSGSNNPKSKITF